MNTNKYAYNLHTVQKLLPIESCLSEGVTISYYGDNGSVPPPYHYSCHIVVSHDSVRVYINTDYRQNFVYDTKAIISRIRYNRFLSQLKAQGIWTTSPDYSHGVGGSTYSLKVEKGEDTVFYGVLGETLVVENGSLNDTFKILLTDSQQDALFNPKQFLGI